MKTSTTAILAMLLAAIALTACGRKGPLEVPQPKTQAQAARDAERQAADSDQPQVQVTPGNKPIILDGSGDNVTPENLNRASNNSFFLDSLL
ncbi:lipoprotein [Martelella sp. HB161492]|uniref:LPS translocon maturation chaperone LptM n=1 Tax=Martelella sp. HB161492 TaxID=2720726 RepID=UPI0015909799|nr:lipoprotein [Martelella sp. HB161492]